MRPRNENMLVYFDLVLCGAYTLQGKLQVPDVQPTCTNVPIQKRVPHEVWKVL